MQAPLFVRPLTEQEQAELEAGRRSPQGFTVRRSHMLLASAQGQSTPTIARLLGCSDQTVRNALADFGCTEAQGWLFGRAISADAVRGFLSMSPSNETPPAQKTEPEAENRKRGTNRRW